MATLTEKPTFEECSIAFYAIADLLDGEFDPDAEGDSLEDLTHDGALSLACNIARELYWRLKESE